MLSGMTPGESNIYTGFEEAEDFSLTALYPNPAEDILTVAFDQPVEKTGYPYHLFPAGQRRNARTGRCRVQQGNHWIYPSWQGEYM